MSRLMSVALTEQAVTDRTKTVTRRKGWRFVKVGDRLILCRKVQGRASGEPLVKLAEVEVTSVRREPLHAIHPNDVINEGFPQLNAAEFIVFFCKHMQVTPDTDPATAFKLQSPLREVLGWQEYQQARNDCTHGADCPVHPNANGLHAEAGDPWTSIQGTNPVHPNRKQAR